MCEWMGLHAAHNVFAYCLDEFAWKPDGVHYERLVVRVCLWHFDLSGV